MTTRVTLAGSKRTPASDKPASLAQVLYREFQALRPQWLADMNAPAKQSASDADLCSSLRDLYARTAPSGGADHQPLSALCLSGGGIRSATFNLGVLQGLARSGLLGSFDYLSSVSGGGYIASWLRTWMHREGTAAVLAQLGATKAAGSPLWSEPKPIASLREYSNYLTPQLGLFSGDTWSAAAIILRNLMLNWLVIVPLLVLGVGIPLLFLLVVKSPGLEPPWNQYTLRAALIVELIASISVYYHRRFVKQPGVPQARFILLCVLPVGLAAGLLSTAALNLGFETHDAGAIYSKAQRSDLWRFSLVWCIVIPLIGWGLNELGSLLRPAAGAAAGLGRDRAAPRQRVVSVIFEMLALTVSGAVAAWLLVAITESWFTTLYQAPAFYVIFVLPTLLGVYLIARTLFVALASLGDGVMGHVRPESSDDADREWWARLSGWVLLIIVSWTVVTSVCLFGNYLPERFGGEISKTIKAGVAALGGVTGLIAALAGKSANTPATPDADSKEESPLHKWLLAAAAPVFVVCVIILMSWIASEFGEIATGAPILFKWPSPLSRDPQVAWWTCWCYFFVLAALAVFAVIAGRVVNVNRFSLHGMYRNRLVRAYLGASNARRRPDPFTGFSSADNPRLHEVWHDADPAIAATRPLPIINATLNLVQGGDNLAWQERKAASFSMTPFYCGNWREGYRPSREYGGYNGISVGTAVAISGAAANPNMGFSSSPALGFLMAVFNVRLGAWLGNTNGRGQRTFRFPGPRQAIMPMFAEIFGLTNSHRRYVNLSDGGHFDNLGLYEVVLRRCRHILVSDAGQDGSFAFEDLGNAIRKIRIDMGIPIEFEHRIKILPNSPETKGLYCAQAIIRYSAVDGTDSAHDGSLVYFKPTLRGRGLPIPADVYSYARKHSEFPHESTKDQWFSESQFESYRALGLHAVTQVSGGIASSDFDKFLVNVGDYLHKKEDQDIS
jgi:Patatin-like phospholipase